MARTRNRSGRRRGNRDFHAERVRRRKLWRGILLAVFVLAGAAMVVAAMSLLGR